MSVCLFFFAFGGNEVRSISTPRHVFTICWLGPESGDPLRSKTKSSCNSPVVGSSKDTIGGVEIIRTSIRILFTYFCGMILVPQNLDLVFGFVGELFELEDIRQLLGASKGKTKIPSRQKRRGGYC
jgi:hypothetical protein